MQRRHPKAQCNSILSQKNMPAYVPFHMDRYKTRYGKGQPGGIRKASDFLRGPMQRPRHGRQIQQNQVAIIAGDGDRREGDGENKGSHKKPRDGRIARLAPPQQQDQKHL